MWIILPTASFLYLKLITRSHMNEHVSVTQTFQFACFSASFLMTLGNSLFVAWRGLTASCQVSTWRVFKPKKFPLRNSLENVHLPQVFATFFFPLVFLTGFFHHYICKLGEEGQSICQTFLSQPPQRHLLPQLPARSSMISAASRERFGLKFLERSVRSCFSRGWFLSKTIRNNVL